MNDLDRFLSDDDSIVPSAGFSARVMTAVRDEAAAPPPIPFPWRRLLPISVATIVVVTAGLIKISQSPPRTASSWSSASLLSSTSFLSSTSKFITGFAVLEPLALPLAAVLFSLLLAEGSLRLVGARR